METDMKTLKNVITMIFIAIIISLLLSEKSTAQDYNKDGLSLTLALEKKTYLLDEPIYVEIIETNITEAQVVTSHLSRELPEYFRFLLKNQEGHTFPYLGTLVSIDIMLQLPGKVLEPGESHYRVNELLAIFGYSDESHSAVFFLPAGKYTIKAIHNTKFDWPVAKRKEMDEKGLYGKAALSIQVDKGRIESQTLSFEIIEPTGRESEIRNKYLDAMRISRNIAGRIPVEVIPIYKSIINDDFESVYERKAYVRLLVYVREEIDVYSLLDRYKNTFFSNHLLSNVSGRNVEGKYEKIINNYPNTKVGKYAKMKARAIEQRIKNNPQLKKDY